MSIIPIPGISRPFFPSQGTSRGIPSDVSVKSLWDACVDFTNALTGRKVSHIDDLEARIADLLHDAGNLSDSPVEIKKGDLLTPFATVHPSPLLVKLQNTIDQILKSQKALSEVEKRVLSAADDTISALHSNQNVNKLVADIIDYFSDRFGFKQEKYSLKETTPPLPPPQFLRTNPPLPTRVDGLPSLTSKLGKNHLIPSAYRKTDLLPQIEGPIPDSQITLRTTPSTPAPSQTAPSVPPISGFFPGIENNSLRAGVTLVAGTFFLLLGIHSVTKKRGDETSATATTVGTSTLSSERSERSFYQEPTRTVSVPVIPVETKPVEKPIPEELAQLDLLTQPIFFDLNSAELKTGPVYKRDLGVLVGWMIAHPEATVEITGYSDPLGTKRRNLQLTERRTGNVIDSILNHPLNLNAENPIKASRCATIFVMSDPAEKDQPVIQGLLTSSEGRVKIPSRIITDYAHHRKVEIRLKQGK